MGRSRRWVGGSRRLIERELDEKWTDRERTREVYTHTHTSACERKANMRRKCAERQLESEGVRTVGGRLTTGERY